MKTCQRSMGVNLKGLPLEKFRTIWALICVMSYDILNFLKFMVIFRRMETLFFTEESVTEVEETVELGKLPLTILQSNNLLS